MSSARLIGTNINENNAINPNCLVDNAITLLSSSNPLDVRNGIFCLAACFQPTTIFAIGVDIIARFSAKKFS
jgi:hypothetical protein